MEQPDTLEIKNPSILSDTSSKRRFSFWYSSLGAALKDYIDGFLQWRLWIDIALGDMRRRYRRTVIGPFWTTLSLAIFVTSMGILFSLLWHMSISNFLPYFASGFICWTFFSAIITDGCQTFVSGEGLLKQVALPYALFAWLVVARNFLVFLHQIVVYIVIAWLFHVPVNENTLLVIPGFLLLFFSGSWIAIFLGFLCARYRDVQQVISSLLQISMFLTPIFWPVDQLGHSLKAYVLMNGNVLYHYIAIVRQPLLGLAPAGLSWWVVSVTTLLGWLLTLYTMARKQKQLIFWLL